VAEHGAADLREVGLAVRHHVVVGDGGADLGRLRRAPDREPAAGAEPDRADLAVALRVLEHLLDGPAHVLHSLVHVQRHQLLLGLVRLLGGVAVVEVGSEGDEPLLGEAVAHLPHAVVESPPLVDHDHAGALAVGLGEIAAALPAVGLEFDVWHLPLLLSR
jgi:hypothetical protein